MDGFMKQSLLKSFIVSFILITLVFIISPSSSSSSSFPNQETRVSTQKTQTYLNGDESPHQLVYNKKTTPFIMIQRQRDHHRRLRYNQHYHYYYLHNLRRRGLHHRADYVKMTTKKSNGLNRPVQSDTFSVMLPKGFVPPSGSSPSCHNQNPNSATTIFCHLSTQP